jgi:hypothetical protein
MPGSSFSNDNTTYPLHSLLCSSRDAVSTILFYCGVIGWLLAITLAQLFCSGIARFQVIDPEAVREEQI